MCVLVRGMRVACVLAHLGNVSVQGVRRVERRGRCRRRGLRRRRWGRGVCVVNTANDSLQL